MTIHAQTEPGVRAAAIGHDGGAQADALLAQVVAELQAQGRRLEGLLMRHEGGMVAETGCGVEMVLHGIAGGERFVVSQPMGRLSQACRADPQGFARASVVLRRVLQTLPQQRPDLVVLNRFGRLEAEGGGLSAELLDLMAEGVPVLTSVAPAYRSAWLEFSGGAEVLPVDHARVCAWLQAQWVASPA